MKYYNQPLDFYCSARESHPAYIPLEKLAELFETHKFLRGEIKILAAYCLSVRELFLVEPLPTSKHFVQATNLIDQLPDDFAEGVAEYLMAQLRGGRK